MKPFIYFATVERVVDGDTVYFDIDMGFNTWKMHESVRLMGIDTPEKRTRDLLEKQFGLLAAEKVEELLPPGKIVLLETVLDKTGKFGRVLANVWITDDMTCVNEYLVDNHYAVIYEGQNRDLIKEAHLANYKLLVDSGEVILNEGLTFPDTSV